MHISINQVDGIPIYQQIVNQIRYLIGSGALVSGEEIPPIRTLAQELLVNPNTVARAYRELQVEGYLIKKGTRGTYVSDSASPMARSVKLKILNERIGTLLSEAEHMNVGVDEIKTLIDQQANVMNIDSSKKTKRGKS